MAHILSHPHPSWTSGPNITIVPLPPTTMEGSLDICQGPLPYINPPKGVESSFTSHSIHEGDMARSPRLIHGVVVSYSKSAGDSDRGSRVIWFHTCKFAGGSGSILMSPYALLM